MSRTQDFGAAIQSILWACGLSESATDKIDEFLHYIMQANQHLNLMSRKLTADDILRDHIQDCLVGVKYFEPYSNIADLGTGGGFPGILLSIVYPDKHFDLYDKSVRKCEYLTNAKRDLHIPNIDIHNRLVAQTDLDSDAVTCRAFKPICEIVAMTKRYFDNGGRYILYKGRLDNINEDLSMLAKYARAEWTIEPLGDRTDKERNMVLLHKILQ